MGKKIDVEEYKYKHSYGVELIFVYLLLAFYIGMFLFTVGSSAFLITEIIKNQDDPLFPSMFAISVLILGFIIVWINTSRFINLYPDFKIHPEGVQVRLFNFWFFWKLIPFEKIIHLRPARKNFSLGPFSKPLDLWMIKCDVKLTRWHTWLNRVYGEGDGTAIFIMPSLIDREILLSQIFSKVGKTKE